MKARRQISPLLSSRKDVPGNEGLMSNQQFNQALIVQGFILFFFVGVVSFGSLLIIIV